MADMHKPKFCVHLLGVVVGLMRLDYILGIVEKETLLKDSVHELLLAGKTFNVFLSVRRVLIIKYIANAMSVGLLDEFVMPSNELFFTGQSRITRRCIT
jgi:hypothetical protein